jgi:hypothetical protein
VAFTRTWLHSALRASVVTLLVPIGVLIAILATELGSGFGGLGSLRELVSGPAVPAQQVSAVPTPAHGSRASGGLPVIPSATGAAPPIIARPAAPARRPGAVAPRPGRAGGNSGHGTAPARPRPPQRPTGPGRLPPVPAAGGSPLPVTSPGSGAPAPAPNPVRQLGQVVQGVVVGVPVVGPGASNVVGTLINILTPQDVRSGVPPPPLQPPGIVPARPTGSAAGP